MNLCGFKNIKTEGEKRREEGTKSKEMRQNGIHISEEKKRKLAEMNKGRRIYNNNNGRLNWRNRFDTEQGMEILYTG
jgi:hypothetical protein